MTLAISKTKADELLRSEAAAAETATVDASWRAKMEHLSALCEAPGSSRTHIAFLCTAMVAKALEPGVDLRAIKPTHAEDNSSAYSARSLCHAIVVPLSAELGFSIGVTGREPLNNQPYFRMKQLGDGTPVHAGAQAAFDYMMSLVDELQHGEQAAAKAALRAFIAVRRQYQRSYAEHGDQGAITPTALVQALRRFVAEDSEGGRRAQAAVAALLDVVVGEDRVQSGRINDPSRNSPGDVCVLAADGQGWEKAIEVRDKRVTASDVHVFCRKCLEKGVRDAAVVAVASDQPALDEAALSVWADENGVGFTLFTGWDMLVDQALFWAGEAKPAAAALAVTQVCRRLAAVEASPAGLERWLALARGA